MRTLTRSARWPRAVGQQAPTYAAYGVLLSLLVQAACSSPSETGAPADAVPPPIASHLWSDGFGGNGSDEVSAVAVDGEAEVTAVGDFGRTAEFGGPSFVTEPAHRDIFVAHYTADGEHIWSRAVGGDYFNYGCAVASLTDGSVVVTADGAPGIDLGGGALASGATTIAKLSRADGSHIWSKDFPDAPTHGCSHVAASGSGIVIAGTARGGAADFGGELLEPISGLGTDVYTVRLSADGDHLWSRRFGGTEGARAHGIAAAGTSEFIVVGAFQGTITSRRLAG